MPNKLLKPSDYDYELPEGLIARYPSERRTSARMMILDLSKREVRDAEFRDLPKFLQADDLLVLNNSRVIPSRFFGKKSAKGTRLEFLRLRREEVGVVALWHCLAKPAKKLKVGDEVEVAGERGRVLAKLAYGETHIIFENGEPQDADGQIALPPYLRREAEEIDLLRYQCAFAKEGASVAAPTAGLHFDKTMLQALNTAFVRLDVGAATFRPFLKEEVGAVDLDGEFCQIDAADALKINAAKNRGSRLIAVGTTSTRALESAVRKTFDENCANFVNKKCINLREFSFVADEFIAPPYDFKIVDGLLTNFHLPRSSLMMLVCAFISARIAEGKRFLFSAYQRAIAEKYRFYSYGDCMLILP